MSGETVKITRLPNGWYIWTCPIDREYYRRSLLPGFRACVGIAVFIPALGGVLSWRYKDIQALLVTAACTGVFALIILLVFGWAASVRDPSEQYEMTDSYVKTGSGKSSFYFDFEKARTAVFGSRYVELWGRVAKMRVYAPEEDMEFVKRHIRNRLTGGCDIRYIS